MFSLIVQIEELLNTKVEQLNNKINLWLRTQAEFLLIYKSIEENCSVDPNLVEGINKSESRDSCRTKKSAYNMFVKDSNKSDSKRSMRLFSETDRAFNWDQSIQTVNIPSISEWGLSFIKQNEAEIN